MDGAPGNWSREEQLAWAAGFFDGEGTTSSSGEWDTPRMTVPQAGPTMPEVLVLFQAIVGFGSILGPVLAPGHQPYWTLAVSGPKALRVLELLRPFLGPVKRQQADAALRRYRRHPTPSHRITALTARPYARRSHQARRSTP
jgi:hypothetical protein